MPLPRTSRTTRPGALTACAALLLALTACSGEELPELSNSDARTCASLTRALPDTLLGLDVDSRDDRQVRYDDVQVTCGVDRPEDYAPTATCNEVEGVGWYVPTDILTDPGEDLVAYALSHEPYVRLEVPADRRVDGMDDALFELADVIRAELGEGLPCL
jgi:hypothetical protein